MTEEMFVHELPNGMTLVGQKMPNVSSAAMTVLVPGGASRDAGGCEGAAAIAADWCMRGAGNRDTRSLHDALDSLGCRHGEHAHSEHIGFSTAQLGRNLPEVLEIYADVIRRPGLQEATFEPCRDLVRQDLAALEDEPAHKCSVVMREKFYPYPLGRCIYGRAESLAAMTAENARTHVRDLFTPAGCILSAAGKIDWDALRKLAEARFGDWRAAAPEPVATLQAQGGSTHIRKQTSQVHIALAHKSAPLGDRRYYAARMAESILSGGMSSRLFTEVREKRGLVYHVSSQYHCLKGLAGMFTYAGTRPEAAQETFDVTVRELRRLAEGIGQDELARSRTQLKSALVMQSQSTVARAAALAADFYYLGRLRSLEEVSQAVDNVTADDVLAYLKDFPADGFTTLVIGPKPLDTTSAES